VRFSSTKFIFQTGFLENSVSCSMGGYNRMTKLGGTNSRP